MKLAEWLWHCLWPLGSSSNFSEPQLCICKKTDLVIFKLSLSSEKVWFKKTAFKNHLETPAQTVLLDQLQRPNVKKNILFPTSTSSETGFFRLSNNVTGGLQYLATTKKKIIIVLNQQMLCSPLNRSLLFLGNGKCKERWWTAEGATITTKANKSKTLASGPTSARKFWDLNPKTRDSQVGTDIFRLYLGNCRWKCFTFHLSIHFPIKGDASVFWVPSGIFPSLWDTTYETEDCARWDTPGQAGREAGRWGLVYKESLIRGLAEFED